MKQNHYPAHIQSKLDELAHRVEHFTEQAARIRDAIAGARQRLSGGFQQDQEFTDLRASLDQLVKDQPLIERTLRDAEFTLADCRAWLDALPSEAVLEPVAPAKSDDDLDLDDVRQRIADAEDEIKQLRAVPVPAPDIKMRIETYVSGLARPRVGGVAAGQQLRVDWPSKDPVALLAFLLPEAMADALMKEIERHANTPMSPAQRAKRSSELEVEVESLQRQALTLGADACVFPPPVILNVRVSRQTKRAA